MEFTEEELSALWGAVSEAIESDGYEGDPMMESLLTRFYDHFKNKEK